MGRASNPRRAGIAGDNAEPNLARFSAGGAEKPTQHGNKRRRRELDVGASADANRMGNYIVYRDGVALITLPVSQLSYNDTGLAAGTTYRYYVIARDVSGQVSAPSNTLTVTTNGNDEGQPGNYPE